jgi:hypothetical protein
MPHTPKSDAERADAFDRVAQLQTALPDVWSFSLLPFTYANDLDFAATIEAAATRTPRPADKRALAIGLIIGNGYIASALPELDVDAVVMLDMDGGVLRMQQFINELLARQATDDGFGEEIGQPEAFPAEITRIIELSKASGGHTAEAGLRAESYALGRHHFLSSAERYRICRDRVMEVPFAYAQADITNASLIGKLGLAMADAGEITFFNATNVAEHILRSQLPAYEESLAALPFHPDAFVAYSSFARTESDGRVRVTAPPACYWAQGVEAYTAAYRANLQNTPYMDDPTSGSGLVYGAQPGTEGAADVLARYYEEHPLDD